MLLEHGWARRPHCTCSGTVPFAAWLARLRRQRGAWTLDTPPAGTCKTRWVRVHVLRCCPQCDRWLAPALPPHAPASGPPHPARRATHLRGALLLEERSGGRQAAAHLLRGVERILQVVELQRALLELRLNLRATPPVSEQWSTVALHAGRSWRAQPTLREGSSKSFIARVARLRLGVAPASCPPGT